MKAYRVRMFALCLGMALLMMSVHSQEPTRLQLVFTGNKGKAETVAKRVEELGYGPAEIREEAGGYKVLTRAFDSYAEANFYKSRIRRAGFIDAFAVKEKSGAQNPLFGEIGSIIQSPGVKQLRIDFQTKKTPIERPKMTPEMRSMDNEKAGEGDLFQKAMAFRWQKEADEAIRTFESFIRRFPESEKLARAKLMRAYWLLEKKERSRARKQFEAVALEHPDTQEAGEAHLRCSYLMLLDRSPDPYILKRFLLVARGDVPAEKEVRVEAMMRCAALYYRMRDLDTAEAAYQAIEAAAGNREVQAFAQMQRAAVLLEKAYNGKVPYSESRALCDHLLKNFPEVNVQTRSTAALMLLETLCREDKYEEVVLHADDFFREFLEVEEAPVAHYWIAKAYHKTGNSKLALDLLNDILREDYNTDKRFRFLNVDQAARRLASDIADKAK